MDGLWPYIENKLVWAQVKVLHLILLKYHTVFYILFIKSQSPLIKITARSNSVCFIFFISSGYDFGYMLKVLTNQTLPEEEQEFFELLKLYFPNIYDVKYLMKSCKNLKGGLQEVAEQLEVQALIPFFKCRQKMRSKKVFTNKKMGI